ncbi:MAG: tRNA 2-thiouridine(34) synthase MnmA [Anaerolineales bacterium]|nr:tRNA 2-thiouridine(34) synthase MnmA [Anaerolineales bacterium]
MTNYSSNTKKRVVVAMSGGVDSSVAAALLVEQGYDVIGMMMRLWSEPSAGANAPANRCCTPDQMADARHIADQLGIPFYVIDVQSYFYKQIVQFFIDEHEKGVTPNPCLECNRKVRFTYLLEHAMALEADYLATGHYARVRCHDGTYELLKGLDAHKDQSYVLHMLTQEHLAHVLFPVGDYTKQEVRELARKYNLPVASKDESQDLCFLGDGDYRRFLREHGRFAAQPGPILDHNGQQLGQHTGLANYTIGQRKGLGISTPEPVYVLRKNATQNALIVGPRAALGQQQFAANHVNWMNGRIPTAPVPAHIKIRYKAVPVSGVVTVNGNGRCQITLEEPTFGITPGQGAVFYNGDICLGGGIIAGTSDKTIPIQLADNPIKKVAP